MNKLKLSAVIMPEVQGDEQFFARKARNNDFDGLMDPIIGFDHFELTHDIFGPHPHAGMSAISYVFEKSASYHSIDSRGNNVIITPGSLLWTYAGKGIVHSEFPVPDGAAVEGLQLFVNIPASQKQQDPKSIFIDKLQIPEIKQEGVRVRVVCGGSGTTLNKTVTPDELTILHVFLEAGKEFSHQIPAQWSGTVLAVEGYFDFMTNQSTTQLEEGMVIAMGESDFEETIKFIAITNSELLFISGKPLHEPLFSKGALVMDSEEALANATENFKNGKMGFIERKGENRKVIKPV
ncbi:pirin family protein [Flavobacterium sp. Root186]|uniref:pirin family protein n=1 Tax=Flavobacterium sp. Root186 TaxID=1736485 RepID=UPI0018FE685A|nr:pirin-like C-terminal cupin domain-containing protein [Flavobacterium sp. Root186]